MMIEQEREVMDRACAIARKAFDLGMLVPLLSLPEGASLRCGLADAPLLRERFKEGTPIEVDAGLAEGDIVMTVTVPRIAEHIECTIGFVNPPGVSRG